MYPSEELELCEKKLTVAELQTRDLRKRHFNWTSGEFTVSVILVMCTLYTSLKGASYLLFKWGTSRPELS